MPEPRFATLADWLSWQETLHPRAVELGLDRVRAVLRRLQPQPPSHATITVGGTNGKGSCVAFLEAMLRAAGYRVGAYTSPHLLRYNERIRIDGAEADDAAIQGAFARIDAARGERSLTYFEFGTLAALELFRDAGVEVAVLEVGLGGRLDAVNVVDADAALVASIDIDHVEWLGPDRESIGYEKAGIFRPDRPAICADPDPPARLLDHAQAIGARLLLVGRDYNFARAGQHWRWCDGESQLDALPLPALSGEHQIGNAAAALAALASLRHRLPVGPDALCAGLAAAHIPGRFQIVPGPVEWILDVAHNPHAARVLAENLRDRPCSGRTFAVVGLLADKDADSIIRSLTGEVDSWHPVTLGGSRGRTGEELAARLRDEGQRATPENEIIEACQTVKTIAAPGDRIVVFGSFHTVAPVLAARPWVSNAPLPLATEV
ncbi:MAG: bifunctional tetrahydrofolate synthase/dihydrofolate synthase [Candidatus Competibacter sp.]